MSDSCPIRAFPVQTRPILYPVKHFFFAIIRNSLIQQQIEVAQKHLFLPSFLLF